MSRTEQEKHSYCCATNEARTPYTFFSRLRSFFIFHTKTYIKLKKFKTGQSIQVHLPATQNLTENRTEYSRLTPRIAWIYTNHKRHQTKHNRSCCYYQTNALERPLKNALLAHLYGTRTFSLNSSRSFTLRPDSPTETESCEWKTWRQTEEK